MNWMALGGNMRKSTQPSFEKHSLVVVQHAITTFLFLILPEHSSILQFFTFFHKVPFLPLQSLGMQIPQPFGHCTVGSFHVVSCCCKRSFSFRAQFAHHRAFFFFFPPMGNLTTSQPTIAFCLCRQFCCTSARIQTKRVEWAKRCM